VKNKIASICLLIPTIAFLLVLPQPASANTGWDIQVTAGPDTVTTLTYDQILSLPKTTVYAELYCYGALLISGNWTGVPLTDLLSSMGLNPSGGSIDFIAQDGYKVSIPSEMALQPNVIIAYQRDGMSLAETYRLVLPQNNGNLWISTITAISLGTGTDAVSQSSNSLPVSGNSIRMFPSQVQQTIPPVSTPITMDPKITTPSNITNLQPADPDHNATQMPSPENVPQGDAGLPIGILYVAAFVTIIVVVAGSFVVVRQRKSKV
jgi:DMSO/TMAO reductase YedYZ molybdopterin-dependent catalytic subunit